MFISATTARLVSLAFFARVKEKEAYPTMKALHLMGEYALRRLVLYKDLILNTIKFQK
jgi:uncharacterized membrane protein